MSASKSELLRPAQPVSSYAAACERFAEVIGRDTSAVDPRSRARLVTPGDRTQRAVVFFHGLSNSPPQFDGLAERFSARGYSVYIPRLPYHGYCDRMSTDHARLSVRELVDVAAESLDLAAGLADEVTVSGISLGGVLAMWAAQFRPVAVAAPIAPAMGVSVLPYSTTVPLVWALRRLPNRFIWWDPRLRERLPGPRYAYPRFATHGLAETQRLALLLMDVARTQPPTAHTIWMISNDADLAVSNSAVSTLVRRWRATGAQDVHWFRFPRHLKLFHDVVDPMQPYARTDFVYPILERIIIDRSAPALDGAATRPTHQSPDDSVAGPFD